MVGSLFPDNWRLPDGTGSLEVFVTDLKSTNQIIPVEPCLCAFTGDGNKYPTATWNVLVNRR